MSYNDLDKSVSDASIVELYEFTIGLEVFRYTSSASEIVKSSQRYVPSHIKRSRIKQSQNPLKDGLTLTVSESFELVDRLFDPQTIGAVNLVIFRGHKNDPSNEFVVYWLGRVTGQSISGSTVEISCESIYTLVKMQGLRATATVTCRHAVYTGGCRVNESSFSKSVTVSGINGFEIEFVSSESFVDGYFAGGILRTSSGIQLYIAKHVGNKVYTFKRVNNLNVLDIISLSPGCDGSSQTCLNKFNNLDNFGGIMFLPDVNPFKSISTW